jgi:hypothetical protein
LPAAKKSDPFLSGAFLFGKRKVLAKTF